MRWFVLITLLFDAAAALAAARRPVVVTSCLPLYCWTANIASQSGSVENLLSSRADPHDYAFSPGDARKLNTADLVIVNGLGLEAWLPQWLKSEPERGPARLVNIAEGLRDHATRGLGPRLNPHLWLDPRLAQMGVSNIIAALQRVDPPNASAYQSNGLAYIQRLHRLDQDLESALQPVTNRVIVTYHDAFPYFARRYGLEVAGVVEEVPDVNPSPRALSRLAETIRSRGIRVLFVEPGSRSPVARRIASDLKIQIAELDTIESGELKADAYELRMRANVEVLRRVLR